jgi:hypothetical protein
MPACLFLPILGYFGYLPSGVLVWVFFMWTGKVLGFNTDLIAKESWLSDP